MIKVSIIIPIYNAEKYLRQCIESVRCQTLKELEIICVDDGSIDDSCQIVEQFKLQDTRICLFKQKNQGAGVARNLALRNARGKYVAFLDADDYYIDIDALETMYNASEENGLFACAGLRKCFIDGVVKQDELFEDVLKWKILNYRDFQFDYDYQNYIFLREILEKNKIYFPVYRRYQDPPFLVRILYQAKQFMVVDKYLYCYRVSDLMSRFNGKNTYDLLCGLIDNLIFSEKNNLNILFDNTIFRLEYEYRNIILKNIGIEEFRILKLLMQANEIICRQKGDFDYSIKPLRMILLCVEQYEKKLLEKIKNENNIVIFGAGKYGQAFLRFLKKNHVLDKVVYVIVSNLKGNDREIESIPVITFDELQRIGKIKIFITVGEKIQSEIKEYLEKNQYQQYEIVRDEFLYHISNETF